MKKIVFAIILTFTVCIPYILFNYKPLQPEVFQTFQESIMEPSVIVELNSNTSQRDTQPEIPSIDVTTTSFEQTTSSPSKQLQMDDWTEVGEEVFTYSAYWDSRFPKPFVRIIGGFCGNSSKFGRLKCFAMFTESERIFQGNQLTFEVLPENHRWPCYAAFFLCVFNETMPPNRVSLAFSSTELTKWMVVHNTRMEVDDRSNLTVCVRPLFDFKDAFRIAEFVAYYEALGVEKFVFYNLNSGDDVLLFFGRLRREKTSVVLLPWTAPRGVLKIWSMAQLANIQDCIYRNMYTTTYLAIVDMDEFITPRRDLTLNEILQKSDKKGSMLASFSFRSTVFCLEYKKDSLPIPFLPFVTQSFIQRERFIYPSRVRSKYILKPESVVLSQIHFTDTLMKGWREVEIPVTEALVHHYRRRLCKDSHGSEVDVTSRKYLRQLMSSKVMAVWNGMFGNGVQ